MIGERDIQEIKSRVDMIDLVGERVTLRRKGRLYWGNCPFHKEKTPSFKVDPEIGLYHCFGCGESGDCFSFVMKLDGLEFTDAARMLADRAHYQIIEEERPARGVPRGRLLAAHTAAQDFYHRCLLQADEATAARSYLAARGFHSDIARRFGLGWAEGGTALVSGLTTSGPASEVAAPGSSGRVTAEDLLAAGLAVRSESGRVVDRFRKRLIFPIADVAGRVIAFGGRVIDDGMPKYLNSADSPIFSKGRVLYALDGAKKAISAERVAIIVEGYTDVMAAHAAGVENVVATLGTAFTEDHLRVLSRFADTVVLVFDADAAGLAAAERGLKFASEYGVPSAGLVARVVDAGKTDVRVAVLEEGKDPADVLAEGAEAFRAAIAASEPLIDFAIERRIARHDLGSLGQRLDAAREALEVVGAIDSAPARGEYLERLSTRLHLEMHALEKELARMSKSARPRRDPKAAEDATGVPAGPVEKTPELAAEQEALAALLHRPELLAEYAEALGEELFSGEQTRQVWEALAAAGPKASTRDLMSTLAGHPAATEVLASSVLADKDVDGLADNFAEIFRRLKEFSVRRQIDAVSERLARAERAGEPIEGIASELWRLQREKHKWRRPPESPTRERRTRSE